MNHGHNCGICNKPIPSWRKYCSRKCYNVARIGKKRPEVGKKIAKSLKGHKLSESTKRKIGLANRKFLSKEQLDELHHIWWHGHIHRYETVCKHVSFKLGPKVYRRYWNEFKDRYDVLVPEPSGIVDWPLQKFREFIQDAYNGLSYPELKRKYGLKSNQQIYRVCKHYGIDVKKGIQGGIRGGKQGYRISKPESIFKKILDDLNVEYDHQYRLGPYVIDFKIGNYLIEINGDYWHFNPYLFNNPNKKQLERMKADHMKRQFVQFDTDYILVEIWESMLYSNKSVVVDWLRRLTDKGIIPTKKQGGRQNEQN